MGVQFLDALKFVSIADEKVARVFEAPKAFVRLVKHLQVAGIDVDEASPSPPFRCRLLIRVSGHETSWGNGPPVGFIQQGR